MRFSAHGNMVEGILNIDEEPMYTRVEQVFDPKKRVYLENFYLYDESEEELKGK